jgi:L-ascorbate metabolism protein UlaG (beta-lactamase superfamily)
MADDPDAPLTSGGTTRRGLLSAWGRRAAEQVPVPDVLVAAAAPRVDHFEEEPPAWVEPLVSGDDLIADIQASKDDTGLHFWWLGQSGFVVQKEGKTLLLDPYLSDSMTTAHEGSDTPYERISGLAVAPELLSFVDLVVTSHAHLDHLDPGTLPHVLSGRAAFVCSAGSEDVATARAGRKPDAVIGVDQSETFADFQVFGIPAYHEGAPEAMGYAIRSGFYTLYHAGDTRRVQGMAEAVQPHAIDVAFVPISGRSGGTMDGADAARLAYETAAPIAIPCHYEMFRCETASPARFVAECVRLGQEYRLPRIGERVTIDYGF